MIMIQVAMEVKKILLGITLFNMVLLLGIATHIHQEMDKMEFATNNAQTLALFGNHITQLHQKPSQLLKEKLKSLQMDQFQLALMFMKISWTIKVVFMLDIPTNL